MHNLTARQQNVLDYLRDVIRAEGRPPTLRELAAHFGWKSDNAGRQHLRLLRQKGVIDYDEGIARGIRLAEGAAGGIPLKHVPLVGKVAAGLPIEAIENLDGHIGIDPSMFPEADTFALRVQGDSMRDAGIRTGDVAIIRKQQDASEGDIVIAILNGEATLKRYQRKGRAIVLHAENPVYADIIIGDGDDFTIVGVAIGIIRRM